MPAFKRVLFPIVQMRSSCQSPSMLHGTHRDLTLHSTADRKSCVILVATTITTITYFILWYHRIIMYYTTEPRLVNGYNFNHSKEYALIKHNKEYALIKHNKEYALMAHIMRKAYGRLQTGNSLRIYQCSSGLQNMVNPCIRSNEWDTTTCVHYI